MQKEFGGSASVAVSSRVPSSILKGDTSLILKPRVSVTDYKRDFHLHYEDRRQKGILGKPGVQFRQKLTPHELDELKAKNLCYFCHEKYEPGHNCPQRRKMQVYLMEVVEGEDSGDPDTEIVGVDICKVNTGLAGSVQGDNPVLSLNAMCGSSGNSKHPTLRVVGRCGKRLIQILINTGSSHNFLDEALVGEGICQAYSIPAVTVIVADGSQLYGHLACEGFSWHTQGLELKADVIIIPLSGFDLILGVQWMSELGIIHLDAKNLRMEFTWNGKRVTISTAPKGPNRVVDVEKLMQLLITHSTAYLLQLIPTTHDNHCASLMALQMDTTPQGITELVNEFKGLFEEPKGLPPSRGRFDHQIVLKEGINPINLRPYRYPALQKDAIEKLVQEMLDAGIIQHSSSPFASLVVLVKKKDGSWCMCVDYGNLNKATVRSCFPIPLIEDLLDELGKARVFTKLDLRAGYHQIRMREEDVFKTAFQTHSGHYEYLVMPFGLTNAPSTFQGIMNSVFEHLLRKTVLVFYR